ncbi:hypothetical protein BSK66_27710 [Paenibacillus odorifer]|uniref:hypothetical protein n=1 Tax=Paenibacillus TaxID=44249 RepID=UPI0003E1C2A0|nr:MULTISPECIES: hypothetical protein [Paenibacillus]ETT61290.1 hypothetical protein C171_12538 [Paenibacillus sp. FSL H8-237]OMD13744.1 hypothetical protein BJP47_24260 [Paenibacillus odorifer]OME48974.1 hypothetical protein BSK66_27710 [Paenibacillus odorifer]
MKNIYTLGIDQITLNELRNAEYTTVPQNELPDPEQVKDSVLLLTSDIVRVEKINEIRDRYKFIPILYWYKKKGVRGYQSVHLRCQEHQITFIPPRTTPKGIIDIIRIIQDEEIEVYGNTIGFFGTAPGVGCTVVAKAFAKRFAAAGKKVIYLGLDLYDPGHDHKPAISLDVLRPRITGKILQTGDLEDFLKHDGYYYLPGNFDYLSAQDYQEEEIEYLLEWCGKQADIVVADFGSFPESAAWYVGIQKSVLRYVVTHMRHDYRLTQLMDLASHIHLTPNQFQLIINRANILDGVVSLKQLAMAAGAEVFTEFPLYPNFPDELQPGRREQTILDEKIQSILISMGLEERTKKKGIFS